MAKPNYSFEKKQKELAKKRKKQEKLQKKEQSNEAVPLNEPPSEKPV